MRLKRLSVAYPSLKTLQDTDQKKGLGLVAKNSGFSLHAGVSMNGTDRSKIEKLCRYIARPAVALNRLSLSSSGQVIYTLKKAYDDGTTKIVMTQLELMERLAAIVPRPKIHLIRFAGVFAPHYKYRSEVVPKPKQLSLVDELIEAKTKPKSKSRVSWARLLKRVFNIDVTKCNKCNSPMKIIAAIEDPKVIKKILSHLGLPTKAPTPWPVRGPPDSFDENRQFEDSHS